MNNEPSYDIVGYGDEVPGILSLVAAAREYRRRAGESLKILLVSTGNLDAGIGGHLVRGGLAYLDRSSIEKEIRDRLALERFGAPSNIYQELLQKSEVKTIALAPEKANLALREMIEEEGIDLLGGVTVTSVTKEDGKIATIELSSGQTFAGKLFIDSTVNAALAQAAGVEKLRGFETLGLPDSELSVTLTFTTEGLSSSRLKQIESVFLKRFTDLNDAEATEFLEAATEFDAGLTQQLRTEMRGQNKGMFEGDDFIDVRSPAISVAYHSFRGKKFSLSGSGILFDKANIAKLSNNRLSWNALLFHVNSTEAEQLARDGAKPTATMLQEMFFIEDFFVRTFGAQSVKPASELYIRHAGNVIGVVRPLSGVMMLRGGVSSREAFGTFSYHFDVRGGIDGIGERAASQNQSLIPFSKPVFNIGMQHALVKNVPNLAVVSPASGFIGLAASVGRIVEFNVAVGQGLGIAAIIALLENRNFAQISNTEVRKILDITRATPKIFGFENNSIVAVDTIQFETALLNPVVIV